MATRSGGNDGNRRSVVILDPDDGSPVIVIMPEPAAPAASDKALPAERAVAPPDEKK
jgi:hypothetical protein